MEYIIVLVAVIVFLWLMIPDENEDAHHRTMRPPEHPPGWKNRITNRKKK